MDKTDHTQAKSAFTEHAALHPDLVADFKKRSAAFRDFARINPNATFEELAAYRARIKPKDLTEARLFARWCLSELKNELTKT